MSVTNPLLNCTLTSPRLGANNFLITLFSHILFQSLKIIDHLSQLSTVKAVQFADGKNCCWLRYDLRCGTACVRTVWEWRVRLWLNFTWKVTVHPTGETRAPTERTHQISFRCHFTFRPTLPHSAVSDIEAKIKTDTCTATRTPVLDTHKLIEKYTVWSRSQYRLS